MATASTRKLTVSPFSVSYSPISSPPSSTHRLGLIVTLDITDSNTPYGSQPCIYQPDAYALSDYATYEHCYDAAKRYLASAPVPVPPVPTIDSLDYGAPKLGAPTTKRRGLQPSSASGATLEHRRKKRGKNRIDVAGVPLTRGRRSKRDHPCPTPGCSKSYLNPNGPKYHQEKGTCKIELPVEFRVFAAKTTVPLSTSSTTALATFIAPMTTDLPKSPSPLSDVQTTPEHAPPHHLDYIPLSVASHRYEHKESHHPQHRQLRVCDLELMANWGTKS
ncbi:hypothetical protein E4T56_gene5070 [Termitomyces sp. T112]|nr:hypothetical protein E4T56_gene5070 [Termitomyces sp. T112]